MSETHDWVMKARAAIQGTLQDPVLLKLLEQSNLTRTQFETILVDQIGNEIAEKTLSREEMTRLRRNRAKISRGAFNRTLQQARGNVAEAVHTVLLLGWSGLLESPSLAPFVEASERLRIQTEALKQASSDETSYRALLASLLEDMEDALDALRGRKRDM